MKIKVKKHRSSPNTMKNNAPNIGCGMVTKNAPNLLITPNIIIINAELCMTRRLPTYKYSFTNVTLPGINSHLDHIQTNILLLRHKGTQIFGQNGSTSKIDGVIQNIAIITIFVV